MLLTNVKQFRVDFCYNFDEVDVLSMQFFVAPLFKKLCNLFREMEAEVSFIHINFAIFQVKEAAVIRIPTSPKNKKKKSVNTKSLVSPTFGIRCGFFAAYSQSLVIFFSFGGPSCIYIQVYNYTSSLVLLV